jgi:hypothetical protein
MSSKGPYDGPAEDHELSADRRSSYISDRLSAGILLLYQRRTGAREADPFVRDAATWSAFEQAALPEMQSFTFFDRSSNTVRTPNSVLADAMGEIWMAQNLLNAAHLPTTLQIVSELAKRIVAAYEISPVERRGRKRASLGLNFLA